MTPRINYIAILVCGIINMVLGMAWYGALAEPWMAAHNITREGAAGMNPAAYGVSFALAFFTAYIMSLIFNRMEVKGLQDGLKNGVAIGIFPLAGWIVNSMFTLKPISVGLIDGGFYFVLFTLFGGLLGGWQRRAAA